MSIRWCWPICVDSFITMCAYLFAFQPLVRNDLLQQLTVSAWITVASRRHECSRFESEDFAESYFRMLALRSVMKQSIIRLIHGSKGSIIVTTNNIEYKPAYKKFIDLSSIHPIRKQERNCSPQDMQKPFHPTVLSNPQTDPMKTTNETRVSPNFLLLQIT